MPAEAAVRKTVAPAAMIPAMVPAAMIPNAHDGVQIGVCTAFSKSKARAPRASPRGLWA